MVNRQRSAAVAVSEGDRRSTIWACSASGYGVSTPSIAHSSIRKLSEGDSSDAVTPFHLTMKVSIAANLTASVAIDALTC